MTRNILALMAVPAFMVGGCQFDEGLDIQTMTGKVVVPRAAATRTFTDAEGNDQEVTDVKLIGPVYLGLFSGVENGIERYPHPLVGPAYQAGLIGDTYPYGGTTVGDFHFACVEFLSCKVVSGRYQNFDELVSWFNDTVGETITDGVGLPVDTGEFLRQRCYEILQVTTDDEVRLTNTRDKNGDGAVDAQDLDFVENADGDFEASFSMINQEFVEGLNLWGWMDAPSGTSYKFSTCDPTQGYQYREYNETFTAGRAWRDLLNRPSDAITEGDWVSGTPHIYSTIDDEVVINLDYLVGQ
jgi:hypothetical protein